MQRSSKKTRWVDVFVHRPVAAVVLSAVICLAGLWAAQQISIQQFPKIESSALVIRTIYTGASAEVVKGFVTEPIERVAATVPGVEYVDSTTKAGHSTVTAWLRLNEDSTRAQAELNARLSEVLHELPAAAEEPVIAVRRTDRPHALFYLNVEAAGVPLAELTDYLLRQVTPIVNNIDGVQKADIEGRRTPAMRIALDAQRMRVFNVSAADVQQALAANNAISTLGYTETSQQRIDIVARTQLSTPEQFERIRIPLTDGTTLYLRDVASIERAYTEPEISARLNQQDTVYIAVWPLPGANEMAVGDRLYQVIAQINDTLPAGMRIHFAYDGTLYMRDALQEIFTTLGETVILVGIVVLLMMGSFKTALVPLVTIPISILGAVAAMYVCGLSLNLLTVLAIVLSVGLVVDDAIVVVENVARHVRNGVPPVQAAVRSSRQLLAPIVSMTLTLALVYAPLGFVSGLTGALVREFAFTLAIAVLISGLVAVTLSPLMSARVAPRSGSEGGLTRAVNRVFESIQRVYARGLARVLGRRGPVLLLAGVIAALMVPFYLQSARELAPVEDQSSIFVLFRAPPEASLAYNEDHMRGVVDDLLRIEGSAQMWQNIFPHGAFGGLEFVSPAERSQTTSDLVPAVYGRLTASSGLDPVPILPAPLPTAGQFDVEMVIKSAAPYADMKGYADQLVGAAFASGKFLYADTDLKIDLPQMELVLDAHKIADLGMTVADVADQLGIYLSNNYVNRYDARGRAYQVIPIADQAIRGRPEAILSLNVKSPAGELIPAAAFTTVKWNAVPRQLGAFGQQNAVRIFGGVRPGVTKEAALAALEGAARRILPPSYHLDYAGESRELRRAGIGFVNVTALALVIVYLVLALQFNSFRDPLVVLLGCVPLALSGALLLTFLEWTTLNLFSQIGLITLVGLVAKNGILIVEFANHLQEQGRDKLAAIVEAATTRLRPVLMTTGATVLGHLPLVLVSGAGAEARNSIGIILVAGMLIGTLFTLFVLPVFYLWLARRRAASTDPQRLQALPAPAGLSVAG